MKRRKLVKDLTNLIIEGMNKQELQDIVEAQKQFMAIFLKTFGTKDILGV